MDCSNSHTASISTCFLVLPVAFHLTIPASSIASVLDVTFFFQYNFIEHTHIQLTFTKDNLLQNKNYNLRPTKKKPNTIKILEVPVTKIKWEHNQLSKQNFILYLKETKKADHFVLNSFLRPVVQEIYFSGLSLSRARETNNS